MIPRLALTSFVGVLLLGAALPARGQQEPKPAPAAAPAAKLRAEKVQSSEDVALVLDRLDRLATLQKLQTLGPAALADLQTALLGAARSVVVTGALDDVPLPQALDAVLEAAGAQGGRVSVVLSGADREVMSSLRVSATFHGARDVDAVRALLRLHESAQHDEQAFVEWSEEGGIFVVRATRLDREPDPTDADRRVLLEPFQETIPAPPLAGAWLGVSWTDQNPRGPGLGGVLVTLVLPASPAETAGIQPGDLITGFGDDGEEDSSVMTGDDLRKRITAHVPGDVVIVELVRAGSVRRVSLVLGTTPGR